MTKAEDEDIKIWPGRHVSLELTYENGEVERLELDVVADAQADFDRGFLGESTPLAKAILGRAAGERVVYQAGDITGARILAVTAELSAPPEDQSERREKTVRKAVSDSDRTNAILYASSMNSKWGDYDPDGIKEEDWDK